MKRGDPSLAGIGMPLTNDSFFGNNLLDKMTTKNHNDSDVTGRCSTTKRSSKEVLALAGEVIDFAKSKGSDRITTTAALQIAYLAFVPDSQ
jgi:hypothetical protein